MNEASRKNFLNKKELAEYLGLSIFTIDTWVSQKREIPFVKMGRLVKFDKRDVDKWIEDSKVQPENYEKNRHHIPGIIS